MEQDEKRYGSKTFYALLREMEELHSRKAHDYASSDNPSGNYHFAGEMAVLFSHSPQDAGFIGRLAEKIYRIANLERSGKTPQNESVEDTERDIVTITTLWMADRRDRRRKKLAADKKIQEEMRTGEWSYNQSVPEKIANLTTEEQRKVIEELFPLIHKLNTLHIMQTIDYMNKLLSDRRTK